VGVVIAQFQHGINNASPIGLAPWACALGLRLGLAPRNWSP
jgi:hypothetical protein